jgi:hypothetical protein
MSKQPENLPSTRLQWNPMANSFQSVPTPNTSGKRFIKGPLPLEWFEMASALPGKTLHVALAIWFQVGLERTTTVKLGQKRVARFAVSRDAKYDALRRLAEAGLIELEQRPGQAAQITLVQIGNQAAS